VGGQFPAAQAPGGLAVPDGQMDQASQGAEQEQQQAGYEGRHRPEQKLDPARGMLPQSGDGSPAHSDAAEDAAPEGEPGVEGFATEVTPKSASNGIHSVFQGEGRRAWDWD